MNMFKFVVLLKGINLETVPEMQGPFKELTCSIKQKPRARFSRSVKMENLVNLRCTEQIWSLSKNLLRTDYMSLSLLLLRLHTLLKIMVRVPRLFPIS